MGIEAETAPNRRRFSEERYRQSVIGGLRGCCATVRYRSVDFEQYSTYIEVAISYWSAL